MTTETNRTIANIPFWKLEGVGNDFIFFDGLTNEGKQILPLLSEATIQRICDRHFGIGADGIIVLDRTSEAPFWMRYWNSDGSIAGMCGNGLRCTMHFARFRGYLQHTVTQIALPNGSDNVEVTVLDDNHYRVAMPLPVFDRHQIPMVGNGNAEAEIELAGNRWHGYGVNVGNPHFVIPVTESNELLAIQIGSQLEIHELFPERANVEFVEILNRHEAKLWVWERGCGITLACGSGATATAAALVRAGLMDADRPLAMYLPGGSLTMEVSSKEYATTLAGPARIVFSGTLDTRWMLSR